MEDFGERYAGLKSQLTPEQEEAGVDRLQGFGFFPVMKKLAGDDPLKYDAILEMPADVIYMTLLVEKVEREIKEEYERIMIEKHKPIK